VDSICNRVNKNRNGDDSADYQHIGENIEGHAEIAIILKQTHDLAPFGV
jgi:hypothetical protein